jgi:hypothetical protein
VRYKGKVICGFAVVLTIFGLNTKSSFAQQETGLRYASRRSTERFLYNRPTVSPYLQLTNANSGFGLPNYFAYVRPALEARQAAQQQEQSIQALSTQLNSVQRDIRRDENMLFQTGHPTRFMNFSHFFPAMQAP